jgi:hypothetical protein
MKALVAAAIALFVAVNVHSQTAPSEDTLENQFIRQMMQQPLNQGLLGLRTEKPNEIKLDGVSYSGILVQLTKTDNPLQLINPAAPAEYGSPEDNVVRDPITGRVSGLKLFSISF